MLINNNIIYIVYQSRLISITTIGNGCYLLFTYKTIGDTTTNIWLTNTQNDISSEANNGVTKQRTYDVFPKMYIRNNMIYMVSFGNHWNNIRSLSNPLYKLSTKDLSNANSKFINHL